MNWQRSTLFAFVLFAVPISHGQISSGSLTGSVLDPSGASIPKAEVTLSNGATGAVRTVQTDESGLYNIPALQPGLYHFTARAPGFGGVTTDITVTLNQITREDVHLRIADSTSTINVAASGNLLQTESHEVGQTVDAFTVEQLPSSNRDVFSTLASVANVSTYNGSNSYSDIQFFNTGSNALILGSTTFGNTTYLQDGVNNYNLLTKTANLQPSPEAVSEVSILQNGSSARFDEPTTVNVTTKAGTNQFHGVGYEYLRNDYLNARSYYSGSGSVPPLRYNQFGANIGGPVLKNRLQFFFAYDGLRNYNGLTLNALFPTAAEKSGNFSADAAIYDPNTYVAPSNSSLGSIRAFNGNMIDQTRISPLAKAYIPYLPDPNGSTQPGQNYHRTDKSSTVYDNYLGRLDYVIGKNDTVYGAYERNNPVTTVPGALPSSIFASQFPLKATNVYAQETHVFSSSLVNVARFGYNGSNVFETLGGAGRADYVSQFSVPYVTPTRSLSIPPDLVFYNPYADFGNAFAPDGSKQKFFEFLDEVNKTVGKHSMFFGAEINRVQFDGSWSIWSDGEFAFQGYFTGDHDLTTTPTMGKNFNGNEFADFLLGLPQTAVGARGSTTGYFRQIFAAPYFQDDWKVTSKLKLNLGLRWDFYQAPNDSHGHSNVYDVTTNTNHPGTYNEHYLNFAPRFGFAYSPDSKSVLRGGYGIYYSPFMYTELQFLLANPPNFILQYNIFNFDNPTPVAQSLPPNPSGSALSVFTTQLNMKTPYSQQWNLATQRSFGPAIVATLSYLGTKQTHLQQRINPNQATPGTAPLASRRPYSYIGDVNQASDVGWQNSHALIVELTGRFRRGLTFNANYVWSKALDDQTSDNLNARDGNNLRLDYGRTDYDRTHVFKLSGVFELPTPHGSNRALREFAGGWQLSGIFLAETGTPFSVNTSVNPNIGGNTANYANQTCSGRLAQRSYKHWFDDHCFSDPRPNTIGNAGRNDLVGPGWYNLDAAVVKKFAIWDRVGLQLRLDAFNAFNHPQYSFGGGQVYRPTGAANSSFTQATVVGGARTLQISSKITF